MKNTTKHIAKLKFYAKNADRQGSVCSSIAINNSDLAITGIIISGIIILVVNLLGLIIIR
jgi:hypothetical protein